MEKAAEKGAHIICFPEMGFMRFFPQYYEKKKYFVRMIREDQKAKSRRCEPFRKAYCPGFGFIFHRFRDDVDLPSN